MRKWYLFAVIFSLLSSFAFAENITSFNCITGNILAENFDFSGLYAANNWTYFASSTYFNSTPLNYAGYPAYSFGQLGDRNLPVTSTSYIRKTISSGGIATGNVILAFNFTMLQADLVPNSDMSVILSKSGGSSIGVYVCSGYETGHTSCNITLSGTDAETCTLDFNYTPPFNATGILDLDLSTDRYSFYLYQNGIGNNYGCFNKSLPSGFNITRLQVNRIWNQNDYVEYYLDDLSICNGNTQTDENITFSCYDSDADDIYSKGYVTTNNITFDDYCENDTNYLVEGECISNDYYAYYVDCTNYNGSSCINGRCIQASLLSCPYPILFCDDFDYTYDVSFRGWQAKNIIGNTISLEPNGDKLSQIAEDYTSIVQRLDNFNIQYFVNGYWYSIIDMQYTPVISGQFKITPIINSNSSCIYYKGTAFSGAEVFDFAFCLNSSNIYLKNYTGSEDVQGDNWKLICSGCLANNTEAEFKVSAYFKNRDYYTAFNSSIINDELKAYYNNAYLGSFNITLGQAQETDSIRIFEIIKPANADFLLDEYYVYTGDDKDYDTTQDYIGAVILKVYNTTQIEPYGFGSPCTINEDCNSGKCQDKFCVLKLGSEECTGNSQCISNNCVLGKCSKPSLSQTARASVKENFGSDSDTLNILSLFIMIGIPTALVIASGGASIMILLGVVIFIILGFFFTIFGMLSPFITLGLLVASLIVIVFILIIKGNN